MRRHTLARILSLVLLVACLSGCGARSRSVMLNSVNKFFSNDALLEATARELSIEGDEAAVRIHVMNVSGGPIDGFHVTVHFLDAEGNVLFSDEQSVRFETPLEDYESDSVTASCSGKDVGKIVAVNVTD